MRVLSLFDGMSCGRIALDNLGIEVESYFASEIKKAAIKVSSNNYPDIIQIGDVTKVKYVDGVLYTENGEFNVGEIDLVIGGSPCQDFSIANANQTGLEGKKSSLFYEYLRILKEVNPKFYLLENVNSMKKEDKKTLDGLMGSEGFCINSLNFVPHLRKRLYWTNIPVDKVENTNTKNLQDILEYGFTPKEYSSCLMESHSRPPSDKLRLVRRHLEKSFIPIVYKDKESYLELLEHYNLNYRGLSAKEVDKIRDSIDNSIYEIARTLTSKEMERLQGVKEGYTECVSRNEAASILGDGWNVNTIEHLFKNLR